MDNAYKSLERRDENTRWSSTAGSTSDHKSCKNAQHSSITTKKVITTGVVEEEVRKLGSFQQHNAVLTYVLIDAKAAII
eukprot:scaffold327863_cov59-Attheya_sp.AAC.2